MRFVDLSGLVFGRLTVVKQGPHRSNRVTWECLCSCKTVVFVPAGSLRVGGTASCGCLQKENSGIATARRNTKYKDPSISARNTAFRSYGRRAKERKIAWSLTLEECISLFYATCVYCESPPSNTWKHKKSVFVYNGIDRIDSAQGYISNNVQSCCWRCNAAKNTMSVSEFRVWVARVYLGFNRTETAEPLAGVLTVF